MSALPIECAADPSERLDPWLLGALAMEARAARRGPGASGPGYMQLIAYSPSEELDPWLSVVLAMEARSFAAARRGPRQPARRAPAE